MHLEKYKFIYKRFPTTARTRQADRKKVLNIEVTQKYKDIGNFKSSTITTQNNSYRLPN